MGFSNSTDTAFAEIVLRSLPDENRRNVNLPQNNSSYGPAPKYYAYGYELVVFYLIVPCVHSLFMFYVYKKCK